MGVNATYRITMADADAVDVYLDHDEQGVLCIARQGEDRLHLPNAEAVENLADCLRDMAHKLRSN